MILWYWLKSRFPKKSRLPPFVEELRAELEVKQEHIQKLQSIIQVMEVQESQAIRRLEDKDKENKRLKSKLERIRLLIIKE